MQPIRCISVQAAYFLQYGSGYETIHGARLSFNSNEASKPKIDVFSGAAEDIEACHCMENVGLGKSVVWSRIEKPWSFSELTQMGADIVQGVLSIHRASSLRATATTRVVDAAVYFGRGRRGRLLLASTAERKKHVGRFEKLGRNRLSLEDGHRKHGGSSSTFQWCPGTSWLPRKS